MEIKNRNFHVYYIENFAAKYKPRILDDLFPLLLKKFRYKKDGGIVQKRYSVNFGIDYTIMFRGKPFTRKSLPYPPSILGLKELVENNTKENYNTCFVQCYPSGKVGIKRHQDSEVAPNSKIASISFGAPRKFVFEIVGGDSRSFILEESSLFVICPPTNSLWQHSLPACDLEEWRISIIFRRIVV